MFDHLLKASRRDDSNKWSNIGFGQEITQVETIEVHLRTLYRALENGSLALCVGLLSILKAHSGLK